MAGLKLLTPAVVALALSATAAAEPSALTVAGTPEALSASGPVVALATADTGNGCSIRLVDFAHGGKTVAVRGALPCAAGWDGAEASIAGLWLGAKAVFAVTDDAPTIEGEKRLLWSAKLPRGTLDAVDAGWSWSTNAPFQAGCAWSVAAGGGVVATTHAPNFLGPDNGMTAVALCVGRPTTTILLSGARRTRIYVRGSWRLLAADGRRIALARLDPVGAPTGELALVGLDGKRLSAPHVAAVDARAATRGWLTPSGLVLRTQSGLVGPGWRLAHISAATVARDRVVYVRDGRVEVRKIRGRADRTVLRLPARSSRAFLAAGSFGVALAVAQSGTGRTALYRLTWQTLEG